MMAKWKVGETKSEEMMVGWKVQNLGSHSAERLALMTDSAQTMAVT